MWPSDTTAADDMTASPRSSSSIPPTLLDRAIQRATQPFLVLAVLYLLYNFVKFMLFTKFAEWDEVFVYAAGQLRGGGDIYGIPPTIAQQQHPYTYPPFQALMALPFTFLPRWLSRLIYVLMCETALVLLWRVGWKITGGRPLNTGKLDKWEALICTLGLIAGMRYVQGTFGHQQTDVIIASLLVCGCYFWIKARDFSAATLWGIAAAMKGPPLLLAPYLAWRGRWRAAAWMVVLAVGLNLAPEMIHRPQNGIWLTQWYDKVLKPKSGGIGQWYVDVTINQSIAGAANRFFTTSWSIVGNDLKITTHDPSISPKALKLAVYGVYAILLAAAALVMRRPFRAPASERHALLESAVVFILILLLSPMSHKTHFCILILPGFIVARRAIQDRNRFAAAAIIICTISIGLLDRNFFRPDPAMGDLFAWYGNVMWGAVALGAACLAALAESPSQRASDNAPAA
jgi:hypothetical protein